MTTSQQDNIQRRLSEITRSLMEVVNSRAATKELLAEVSHTMAQTNQTLDEITASISTR